MNKRSLLRKINILTEREQTLQISGVNYDFQNVHLLHNKLMNNRYVISIMGAMKSGKSSFINALLATDLMPNENAACTLTSTDIIHQTPTHKIKKVFKSGKVTSIEGPELATLFHEDIKKYRESKSTDEFIYEVDHKLHALKDKNSHIQFVVKDTPGLNEMDGLGVNKEQIEIVFNEALRETNTVLYLLDYQYYKSEENVEIISKISSIRPDLLEGNIIFVLNKVDKLGAKDGDLDQVLQKVHEALFSWGIEKPVIYPVSSKQALLGRIIETGRYNESFEEELTPFLPIVEIEHNGRKLLVKEDPQTVYKEIIQSSGILQLESEVIEPLFEKALTDDDLSSSQLIEHTKNQLLEKMDKRKKVLLTGQKELKEQMKPLKKAVETLKTGQEKINLKQKIIAEVLTPPNKNEVKGKDFYTPYMNIDRPNCYSDYKYSSDSSAESAGEDVFRSWFRSLPSLPFDKIHSHYSKKLFYEETDHNYFYSINKSIANGMSEINKILVSLKDMSIDVMSVSRQFKVMPQPIEALSHENGKSFEKDYVEDVHYYVGYGIDTNETERYEETGFWIFKSNEWVTKYQYDLSNVVRRVEDDINTALKRSSEWFFEDFYEKKYVGFLKSILDIVTPEIEKVKKAILQVLSKKERELQVLMDQNEREYENLIRPLQEFEKDLLQIDTLSRFSGKTIKVQSGTDLHSIFAKAEYGDILKIESGEYKLKQPVNIDYPITVEGVGKEKPKIVLVNGDATLSFSGDHAWKLHGVTIIKEHRGNILTVDGVELDLKDCSLNGSKAKSLIKGIVIKGNTTGSIINCKFTDLEKGFVSEGNTKLTVKDNEFFHNRVGMEFAENSKSHIENNKVKNNQDGILCTGTSMGVIKSNICEKNGNGIYLDGQTKMEVRSNRCLVNEMDGIGIGGNATVSVYENESLQNGKNGIAVYGKAKPTIKKNICFENKGNGLSITDQTQGTIEDNVFEKNKGYGLLLSKMAAPKVEKNSLVKNQLAGIACLDEVKTTISNNKCNENGNGILVDSSASPTVQGNTCKENTNGIVMLGKASPIIRENDCHQNNESGIVFRDQSKGEVTKNSCVANKNGLEISNEASPIVQENQFEKNKESGIVMKDKATGVITKNRSANNHTGISILNMSVPLIQANKCFSNKENGILYSQSSNGACLENHCNENGGSGILVKENASPSLEKNNCQNNQGNGIAFIQDAGGSAIENRLSQNKQNGLFSQTSASPILSKNHCTANVLNGVSVFVVEWKKSMQPSTLFLEKNRCSSNLENGISIHGFMRGSIYHNECKANGAHGIIQLEGQNHTDKDVLEWVGNICEENSKSGMDLNNVLNGFFQSNILLKNKMNGLTITGSGIVEMIQNHMDQNYHYGLTLNGSINGVVSFNTLGGNQKSGAVLSDHPHIKFIENTCSSNQENGLELYSVSEGSVESNHCHDNRQNGILAGVGTSVSIENNSCQKNQHHGMLLVDVEKMEVNQNDCSHNLFNGIHLSKKADAFVQRNICSANTNGIVFEMNAVGRIKNNECKENDLSGILVTDNSYPTVEGNVCADNKQNGIRFMGHSRGKAFLNMASGNHQAGISLSDSTSAEMAENESKGNYVGIEVSTNVRVEISYNQISFSQTNGIEVTGRSEPLLQNNICFENQEDGIHYAQASTGQAIGNIIKNNGGNGIALQGQATIILQANVLSQNKGNGLAFSKDTGGKAILNQCTQNGSHGIYVEKPSNLLLLKNKRTQNGVKVLNKAFFVNEFIMSKCKVK